MDNTRICCIFKGNAVRQVSNVLRGHSGALTMTDRMRFLTDVSYEIVCTLFYELEAQVND